MKITFPLIKAGSGSDVFIHNLVNGLVNESIDTKITYLPHWSGFFPNLAGNIYSDKEQCIIHANTWYGYAFKQNHPLVATEYHIVHDPLFSPYTTLMQRLYYHHIYRCELKSLERADRVTVISKYTQKKLEEIFGYSDSRLIYCGIDTSLFNPMEISKKEMNIDEKSTVLLFVGNHLYRKGSDLLAPIMRELGDEYLLLTTAGLRTSSKIQFKNIRYLGTLNLKLLIKAYNVCDMLLFPSRLEGFGLCVAEAMSCGKPVVTTNCSSLPELIIDGKGGCLCQMDDVKAYVEAVRHLAEDENLRTRMGRFNRERVLDMFTIEKMTKEYIHLYQRLH